MEWEEWMHWGGAEQHNMEGEEWMEALADLQLLWEERTQTHADH